MNFRTFIVFAGIAFGATLSTAQAAFVTDEAAFDAIFVGTTLNFEGIAPAGTPFGITTTFFPGVTIEPESPIVVSASFTNSHIPFAPSDWLIVSGAFGDDPDLKFNTPVTAVGFDIGTLGGSMGFSTTITIEIFDGATLLDSGVFTPHGWNTFDSFIGIVGLGVFDRVKITGNVDGDIVGFDNFRFGEASIPEPAALTLFGLGLVVVGFARRRASAT
jgi:hypothetical protein